MPATGDLVLMSKDGNTELYRNYEVFNASQTIQDKINEIVNSGINITAVSATAGGQAIDPTESVMTYVGSGEGLTLYDATPQAETITGFFLNGQEYKIGGDEAAWGNISGTLSDQTDLNTALTAKANASDVLTKTNTTAFTPSGDYNPATKKYVDDNKGETYNAGEGIEIGTVQDHSAMQGPAPDGFYVPSKDEWVALCGVLTTTFSMASNATTMGTYLKMPMAGYRYYSNANINNVGSYGSYWSSTPFSADYAYYLRFSSSNFDPKRGSYRSYGYSVRCFKNFPTIPTSSWTTLYDGSSIATGAGVFYNATDGLISVSGDGVTWYTIQDKNLGATTVFNQGDTLTDANCGYFYQWGNNYGFSHSGTVTTSSTQVDASAYGPTNPYSSDTFILSLDWSSVRNDDLWGDTTGTISQEVISNTGVLSVNGQTGDVTIPEPNVLAVTQSEYDALPAATKNDGKLRIITDAPTLDIVDDTAFGASWDGDTDTAPSKNAVYDKLNAMDTTISGKADSSSLGTAATKNTGTSSGNVPVLDSNGKLVDAIMPAGSLTVYCTQSEYDALPSSKTSDGKNYIIYTTS